MRFRFVAVGCCIFDLSSGCLGRISSCIEGCRCSCLMNTREIGWEGSRGGGFGRRKDLKFVSSGGLRGYRAVGRGSKF